MEVDGTLIHPYNTSVLSVSSGQRYSILIDLSLLGMTLSSSSSSNSQERSAFVSSIPAIYWRVTTLNNEHHTMLMNDTSSSSMANMTHSNDGGMDEMMDDANATVFYGAIKFTPSSSSQMPYHPTNPPFHLGVMGMAANQDMNLIDARPLSPLYASSFSVLPSPTHTLTLTTIFRRNEHGIVVAYVNGVHQVMDDSSMNETTMTTAPTPSSPTTTATTRDPHAGHNFNADSNMLRAVPRLLSATAAVATTTANGDPLLYRLIYNKTIVPGLKRPDSQNILQQNEQNVFYIPYGSIVDVIIDDSETEMDHPIHLHGFSFWLMETSDAYGNRLTPSSSSESAFVYRDTIAVLPRGRARIRFNASNPGAWMLHCHIDWHIASGFMATFVVSSPSSVALLPLSSAASSLSSLRSDFPVAVPSDQQRLCPNFPYVFSSEGSGGSGGDAGGGGGTHGNTPHGAATTIAALVSFVQLVLMTIACVVLIHSIV